MNHQRLLATGALAILCCGCFSNSKEPISMDATTVRDARIVGEWIAMPWEPNG